MIPSPSSAGKKNKRLCLSVNEPFGAKTPAVSDHQKFMKSAKSGMEATNSEPVATKSHV